MALTIFIRLLRYITLNYCNSEHPIVLFYAVRKIIEKVIMGAM